LGYIRKLEFGGVSLLWGKKKITSVWKQNAEEKTHI
jgi:hypothetical protein